MSTGQSLITDRFAHWVEAVCRTYVALDVTNVDDSPFRAGIDLTHLGDAVFAELHCTAIRADRRALEIARSTGQYAILILQQSGTMDITQDGRCVRLLPGAATIVDTTRPYVLHAPEPVRQIVLPDGQDITLEVVAGRDASVNFDMQSLASLLPGDRIVVRRSGHQVRFLHPQGWSYYATLRRKLHWNAGVT